MMIVNIDHMDVQYTGNAACLRIVVTNADGWTDDPVQTAKVIAEIITKMPLMLDDKHDEHEAKEQADGFSGPIDPSLN